MPGSCIANFKTLRFHVKLWDIYLADIDLIFDFCSVELEKTAVPKISLYMLES